MKVTTNGTRRAAARLRLFVATLAIAAVIVAEPGEAGAGSEADLWHEGLGAEALGPEGLVSGLRANGAHVLSLGSRGGLDGYFVTPAGGGGYSLYVTGDGHAVAGLLYGPDGTEITGGQLAAARPAAASAQQASAAAPERAAPAMTAHAASNTGGPAFSSPSLTRLFERSAAAFGFTLGERGPLAVLLGDPTCPFSRSAAARLGRAALDGRLQLRVVPVAVLGADAARRAVAIAAHPEPARAWFDGSGVADPRSADRAGAQRIARNNALFDGWGATAVPLIAWQTRDGVVGHWIGNVDDVGAWLVETGLE